MIDNEQIEKWADELRNGEWSYADYAWPDEPGMTVMQYLNSGESL